MHIEERLAEISDTLKAIHTALTSAAAVTTAAPAADKAKTETKTKTKTETPAPTPAPAAPKALTFKDDVMPAILAVNQSKEAGRGRDGVLALLKHFGLEGKRVPDLEGLNKHAEVLAAAKSLLETGSLPGAAEETDDLGI